jgi:hypothetical protein
MARMAMFVAVAFVALAGAAAAQSGRLRAAEVRAELFGVDLSGVVETSGERWRECIDPAGRTLYEIGDRLDQGRMRVQPSGDVCFSYQSTDYESESCWAVRRAGANNYRFGAPDGAEVRAPFLTLNVRRNVSECVPSRRVPIA